MRQLVRLFLSAYDFAIKGGMILSSRKGIMCCVRINIGAKLLSFHDFFGKSHEKQFLITLKAFYVLMSSEQQHPLKNQLKVQKSSPFSIVKSSVRVTCKTFLSKTFTYVLVSILNAVCLI